MEVPEFDENQNLLIESPCFVQEHNGQVYKMTWFNTRLRLYKGKYGIFNHIEHTTDDGQLIGFTAPQETLQALLEESYPIFTMPYIDPETMNWMVQGEMVDLDAELTTFLEQ